MTFVDAIAEGERLAREQTAWQAKQRALVEEREKYARRGLPARVAMVDAELERLADPPGGWLLTTHDIACVRAQAKGEQEREARVAALLAERRGYELRGLDDRVAGVDAELTRLAGEAEAPAKRRGRRRVREVDAAPTTKALAARRRGRDRMSPQDLRTPPRPPRESFEQ